MDAQEQFSFGAEAQKNGVSLRKSICRARQSPVRPVRNKPFLARKLKITARPCQHGRLADQSSLRLSTLGAGSLIAPEVVNISCARRHPGRYWSAHQVFGPQIHENDFRIFMGRRTLWRLLCRRFRDGCSTCKGEGAEILGGRQTRFAFLCCHSDILSKSLPALISKNLDDLLCPPRYCGQM